LILLLDRISPITLVSEGIGFRFVRPFRMQIGELGPLILPQGNTLGLFDHILIAIDRLVSPGEPKPLRAWLDGFAFANEIIFSLLALLALWLGRHHRTGRRLVAAMLLFSVYASRPGIFIILDPDYYAFELAMTLLLVVFAVRWIDNPPTSRMRAIVGLGIFAGLMAGLKFTLAATTLLVLLPLLAAAGDSWWRKCREASVFGLVAGLVFLGVLAAYYLGDLRALPVHFQMLASFVHSAGGEAKFWPSLFTPGSPKADPGADYGYARVVLIVWLATMGGAGVLLLSQWRLRLAVTAGTSVGLAALHLSGLVTRPAGSTLWDICLCLLAGTICTLTELPKGGTSRFLSTGTCLLLASYALVGGPRRFEQLIPLKRTKAVSDAIWQSHQELMSAPPPHIFVFLDGNHVGGTVEEAIMKGCLDFPSGQLNRGKEALRELTGDLEIRNSTADIPANASVLLVEAPGDRFPELERGRSATKWDLSLYPWWPRSVALYRPVRP
jgi:hypothetical protein